MAVKLSPVDGPGGSGKGHSSRMLAKKLGFHYLDSGALYRLLGLAVAVSSLEYQGSYYTLAEHMDMRFEATADGHNRVLLEGEDVTDELANRKHSSAGF